LIAEAEALGQIFALEGPRKRWLASTWGAHAPRTQCAQTDNAHAQPTEVPCRATGVVLALPLGTAGQGELVWGIPRIHHTNRQPFPRVNRRAIPPNSRGLTEAGSRELGGERADSGH